MSSESTPKPNKWRRRCFVVLALWALTTLLMSFKDVRGFVASPLYVSHAEASGEIAYVMADGYAYWERLHAASDLYHMDRIDRIVILHEAEGAAYSFVRQRSETILQRATAYLEMHGVPADKVSSITPHPSTPLGSLSEARGVAEQEPEVQSVVVVTSAPHTRRSLLAFRRAFPDRVRVQVYAATGPRDSTEVDGPIWIEYVKLLIYYVVA